MRSGLLTTTRTCPPLLLALACLASVSGRVSAALPVLPDSARTHWVMALPEEIVVYLAFDPASVADRLPSTLRFTTLGDLATGGVSWATDFLTEHPPQRQWGISFFKITRARTFAIDGRAPDWPEAGAAALWCARVAPVDSTRELGLGRALLVLDFWVPDSSYAAYMRARGHYATYADVRLAQDQHGGWRGYVELPGLRVDTACVPTGPVTDGVEAAGSQILFPPRSSDVTDMVRVVFAGHKEQECSTDSWWTFEGRHPLAGAIVLEPSTFEFGYVLIGGAYRK